MLSTPLWEWVLQRFGKKTSAFGICVSETRSKAWSGCRKVAGSGRWPWSPSFLGQAGLICTLLCLQSLGKDQVQEHFISVGMKEPVRGRWRDQLVYLSPQVMVPFAILLAAVPTAPVAYVVAFVSGLSIAVSLLLPW